MLTNLLDLVSERADSAQSELYRLTGDRPSADESDGSTLSEKPDGKSQENSARSISVISDVSLGSDDVFMLARSTSLPEGSSGDSKQVLSRNWDVSGTLQKKRLSSPCSETVPMPKCSAVLLAQ